MLALRTLRIQAPIWIASGPLTNSVALLREAEANGAGAVSLKLTFVKEPFAGKLRTFSLPDRVLLWPIDRRLSLEEGVALARAAKREVALPLFANLGAIGDRLDEWQLLARAFTDAGVDGLELNFCCPNLDTRQERAGAQIGQDPDQCERITSVVRASTDLPIVCKMLPNALDPTAAVLACERGGADAIHIVGLPAAGLPPVDVENGGKPLLGLTERVSFGAMNGPACLYSTFMATAQAAAAVRVPVIASGGIATWEDCVCALMWGASAVAVCTAVMWHGFRLVREMTDELTQYLERHGHRSWLDVRGASLRYLTTPDQIGLVSGYAVVKTERCTGCGKCTHLGHCRAFTLDPNTHRADVNRELCVGCGICVAICPSHALEMRTAAGGHDVG